ncbi:MAG: hypothetical protein EON60_11190 [Alphaproteobacteria bacterium]|nr:MAG: hypothetical protein EON60_11190 [Alphaproteobacteria bacterium]
MRKLGTLLIAGLALAGCQREVEQKPCFKITYSPHVRLDTFLLDECTGRVWQFVKTGENSFGWEAMNVANLTPEVKK